MLTVIASFSFLGLAVMPKLRKRRPAVQKKKNQSGPSFQFPVPAYRPDIHHIKSINIDHCCICIQIPKPIDFKVRTCSMTMIHKLEHLLSAR